MINWLDELDEMEQRQLTGEEYDHYVGLLIDYDRELIDATMLYESTLVGGPREAIDKLKAEVRQLRGALEELQSEKEAQAKEPNSTKG